VPQLQGQHILAYSIAGAGVPKRTGALFEHDSEGLLAEVELLQELDF
jgi:hypothetical protein